MTTPDPTATPVAEPAPEPQVPASKPAEQDAQGNVTQLLDGLKSEFSTQLEELRNEVKAASGRGSNLAQAQSDINKAQSTLREQLARLEQYKKTYNLSDDEAIAEMESDDAEAAWRTKLETELSDLKSLLKSGGTGSSAEQNVTSVFKEILGEGLMGNALVVDAIGKNYGSAQEVKNAALELYYQISKSPNPNPAQSQSLDGKSATGKFSSMSDDELGAKLTDLASKDFVGTAQERNEIKLELERRDKL